MTISSNVRKVGPFTGTGAVTVFTFNFKVFQASDLYVVTANSSGVETVLVLNSDYTATLNSNQDSNPGGSITLASALASGNTMIISSTVDNLQPTDLTNQGGFYPSVITDALDRATIQIQQLQEQVDRSAKIPITDSTDAAQLVSDIISLSANMDSIEAVLDNSANINIVADNIEAIKDLSDGVEQAQIISDNIEIINVVASDLQGDTSGASDLGYIADGLEPNGTDPFSSIKGIFKLALEALGVDTDAAWASISSAACLS